LEGGDETALAKEALDAVREKLTALRDDRESVIESISSAASRLKMIDTFANTLDCKRGINIEAGVETYRKEREKAFKDHKKGTICERNIAKEIAEVCKEEGRLARLHAAKQAKLNAAKAKANKAKYKQTEVEIRRRADKEKEKTRIRREGEQF
jgi:hypothetical protein